MLKENTLFIVGAGASSEADLPLGLQLMKDIGQSFEIVEDDRGGVSLRTREIHSAILRYVDANPGQNFDFDEAAKIISRASTLGVSIDNLVHSHSDKPLIPLYAKLGIAHHILKAERDSLLFLEKENDNFPPRTSETWYAKLFSMLHTNLALSDVEYIFDDISFITFNYDRCIEQYFSNALKQYFFIDNNHTNQIMKNLKIEHVFGYLGQLNYQKFKNGFGEKFDLLNAVSTLQTFTEGITDKAKHLRITKMISKSTRIVFLGFSFNSQALKAIAPSPSATPKMIFATTFGMSKPNREDIRSTLKTRINPANDIYLEDLKSADLLEYFSRILHE